LGQDVEAVHFDRATVWLKIASQGLDYGGLASAIGTQQAHDLAGRNVEAHSPQCLDWTIGLGKINYFNHSSSSWQRMDLLVHLLQTHNGPLLTGDD
jgi:hypothetical protein